MNRFALSLAALLLPALAAAVPLEFTHQGRVLDSAGLPVDGQETLNFALYTTATGGSAVWTAAKSVDIQDGFFSVTLDGVDSDAISGQELYLGLAIGSSPELSPRQKVTSVPYAITAHNVRGGTVDASEIKVGGTTIVNSAGQFAGTVNWSQIEGAPSGQADTLGGLSCTNGQVAAWDGTAWRCANAGTDASALVSGTVDYARLPVGTGSNQVAAGQHTHSAADITAGTLDAARLPDLSDLGVAPAKLQNELPGLVLWYDAKDTDSYTGSGTTWRDLSGSGVNATLGACATYGAKGGVDTIIFNGSNCSYAEFANAVLNENRMTAIMWVYNENNGNTDGGLYVNQANNVANSANWVWFGKWDGNRTYFRVNNGPCCQDITDVAWNTHFALNRWYMIHFGYDSGLANEWKWGTNGNTIARGTLPARGAGQSGTVSRVGYGHGGSGEFWKGGVAVVKFYDRALTDEEIRREYYRSRTRFGH